MERGKTTKRQNSEKSEVAETDPFRLRPGEEPAREAESQVHLLGPGIFCDTEPRGHATPRGQSAAEVVVNVSQGFIPLWAQNVTLRWRFRERSLDRFADPAAVKSAIRKLFGEALLEWGTAAPVKFTEDEDLWDFEIVVMSADNCRADACSLARAFFPDTGRHDLTVFPMLFKQSRKEQVDTFVHEIGHIFGLRHFFANITETGLPSEIFGTHSKFSIMNYGELSELTAEDRNDLTRLYQSAWSGTLTHINGTPIQLVTPFHTLAPALGRLAAVGQIQTVVQPRAGVAYIGGV
jgi:hypothetical protein